MNIAVIGGGVFGALAAIRLAEAGKTVSLFERRSELLRGASINANRLHLGFHYPRDEETARQCMRGYGTFIAEFSGAVLKGIQNAYFIAQVGSLVSPGDYLAFCDRLGLRYSSINLGSFQPRVENVEMGILTEEVIFDATILRDLMGSRLRNAGVSIHCESDVIDIDRKPRRFELRIKGGRKATFDGVVNCSYADVGRLTRRLGHDLPRRQYEYTAVPIVEVELPVPVSITVLDGPFVSLLPYGAKNHYLMYHVEHSVIARSDELLLEPTWLDAEKSPFARLDRSRWLADHTESCATFVPALRDARLKGVAQGPRMVLADQQHSDARPSFVTPHQPGYVSVFAGKIDHANWIADAVVREFS